VLELAGLLKANVEAHPAREQRQNSEALLRHARSFGGIEE
jgi:hypothetical protein